MYRVSGKSGYIVKNTYVLKQTILFNSNVHKLYFQHDFHHFNCIIGCALQTLGELNGIRLHCRRVQYIDW